MVLNPEWWYQSVPWPLCHAVPRFTSHKDRNIDSDGSKIEKAPDISKYKDTNLKTILSYGDITFKTWTENKYNDVFNKYDIYIFFFWNTSISEDQESLPGVRHRTKIKLV